MRPRLADVLAIARFELARHLRSRHTIVAGVLLVLCCVFGSWQLSDYADRIAELGREVGPALDMVSGMIEGVTGLPVAAVSSRKPRPNLQVVPRASAEASSGGREPAVMRHK